MWKLDEVDRAVLDGEESGFARVLVRKGSDKILGATIVAAHAGDVISDITLAMTNRLGLGDVVRTIHPYPTQAEVVKKLGDAYNRTRWTPPGPPSVPRNSRAPALASGLPGQSERMMSP